MRDLLRLLALVVVWAAIGFVFGRYARTRAHETHESVRVDTLYHYDTIVKNKTIYISKEEIRRDTVRLVTTERDTVRVEVPIERKVYAEDSLYRAVVTGYRASLDTLVIWPKTTTITIDRTKTIPAPRWSLGVAAGPSALVTPAGKVHAGVGITAGIVWRF